MLRTGICLAAVLLVAGTLHTASAQTTTAPAAAPAATSAPSAAKSSRVIGFFFVIGFAIVFLNHTRALYSVKSQLTCHPFFH